MTYYRVQRNEDLSPLFIIIGINVVVFIATFIDSNLINLLALRPALIASMPWTIITSMFTHANLWHILFNMLAFFFFGRFVMSLLGTRYMLLIYFIGGIVGNIFFMLMAPNSAAVGASGAIYALGGTLIVLRPQLRVVILPIPVPMPLWVAILVGFLILLVPGAGGIAWQAHLGGLILGVIAGFLLRKRTRAILL